MGSWSYCRKCNCGLDRITVEEIMDAANAGSGIYCRCGEQRADDTDQERQAVLSSAILELRDLLKRTLQCLSRTTPTAPRS